MRLPGDLDRNGTTADSEAPKPSGKILSWGVSNFDVEDLEDASAVDGDSRIACNQVLNNLTERAIEKRVLPWCEKHGAVVGYAPFERERFPDLRTRGGRVLADKEIARIDAAFPLKPVPQALPCSSRRTPSLVFRATVAVRRGQSPFSRAGTD